jgi:magnesium chelatase family protein
MDPLSTDEVPSVCLTPVCIAAADLQGVDARLVEIEAFVRGSDMGAPRVIGLADTAVRESLERVRTAFSTLQLGYPRGQLVVNLAPARARKAGTGFDLGIALALACLAGHVPRAALRGLLVCAELGLDGSLRSVPGVLAMVELARRLGIPNFVCANEVLPLAARGAAGECNVIGPANFAELLAILHGGHAAPEAAALDPSDFVTAQPSRFDRVRGQESARRALEIAAAGGHHLLMSGPPGCGKTLLASCLPELLPALQDEERLEVLKIRSLFGEPQLREQHELLSLGRPPFRAPHHTVSYAGLVGGGQPLRPGEITLAHRGVLFLDELPEFRRESLEALRQPLESGEVHVRRANAELFLPASFQLIAAMNPCPCGMLGTPDARPVATAAAAIANVPAPDQRPAARSHRPAAADAAGRGRSAARRGR